MKRLRQLRHVKAHAHAGEIGAARVEHAGFEHLAWSERAPYQAFRIDGLPIFATQFHPELSRESNAYRYERYAALYKGTSVGGARDETGGFRESPGATALLPRWVESVLEGEPDDR